MDVAGAVLTGGASRRMGRDKATLEIDGVAMARRVADALIAAGCAPVVAVGGDATRLGAIGIPVVDDHWPGEGPLGGIITALRHSERAAVVVAACDLPWLDAPTIERLVATAVEHPDADVVHAASPAMEPLCALWRPRALHTLSAALAGGTRAVHDAIALLHAVACPVDAGPLRNINRPGDVPNR